MKKILAIVLSMIMFVGLFPNMSVVAAEDIVATIFVANGERDISDGVSMPPVLLDMFKNDLKNTNDNSLIELRYWGVSKENCSIYLTSDGEKSFSSELPVGDSFGVMNINASSFPIQNQNGEVSWDEFINGSDFKVVGENFIAEKIMIGVSQDGSECSNYYEVYAAYTDSINISFPGTISEVETADDLKKCSLKITYEKVPTRAWVMDVGDNPQTYIEYTSFSGSTDVLSFADASFSTLPNEIVFAQEGGKIKQIAFVIPPSVYDKVGNTQNTSYGASIIPLNGSTTILTGDSETLMGHFLENGEYSSNFAGYEWTSSNSNVVSIINQYDVVDANNQKVVYANIAGNKNGSATITCSFTLDDGEKVSASWNVTVSNSIDVKVNYHSSDNYTKSYNYVYSNDYFKKDSRTYNHDLAILSLLTAMSAFTNNPNDGYSSDFSTAYNGYTSRAQNIRDLYSSLKFFDDKYYNYDIKLSDSSDKVAFSIATKDIFNGTDYDTLVAVVLRGGGYGGEWASNFRIRTGENDISPNGFKVAADEVYDELKKYLNELENSDKIKGDLIIWMTGYSRSAAVANHVAFSLNADIYNINEKKVILDQSIPKNLFRPNVYVYTFATPSGVNFINSSDNNNVFNIIYPVDVVPRVALDEWGYHRLGNDRYIKFVQDENASEILNFKKKYYEITGQLFGVSQKDQLEFNNELFTLLNYIAPDENAYVNNLQALAVTVLKNSFGGGQISGIDSSEFSRVVPKLTKAVAKAVCKSFVKSIPVLGDFISSFDEGKDTYDFVEFVKDNEDTIDQILVVAADVIETPKQIPNIGAVHHAETYLAWMLTSKSFTKTFSYKKLTAKCPVDVYVYDSNNNLVCSIEDNQVMYSTVAADVYGDKKVVCLDTDKEYSIKIVGTDYGTMDYTLEEISTDVTESDIRTVEDIPITPDTVVSTVTDLTDDVVITAASEDKTIEYVVDKNNNVEVEVENNGTIDNRPITNPTPVIKPTPVIDVNKDDKEDDEEIYEDVSSASGTEVSDTTIDSNSNYMFILFVPVLAGAVIIRRKITK